MKKCHLSILAGFTAFLVSACTSYESAVDSHLAREYLTEDLENQIVYNLIRAYNANPFAHYDIGQIQSIVTAKLTPQIGGGVTTTHNNTPVTTTVTSSDLSKGFTGAGKVVTNTLGSAMAAAQVITRPFSWGTSAERDNAVTVNIQPIFDEPKIYAAYVKFLTSDPKDEGTLPQAPTSPTPKPVKLSKTSSSTVTYDFTDKAGNKTGKIKQTEVDKDKDSSEDSRVPEIDFTKFKDGTEVNPLTKKVLLSPLMRTTKSPDPALYIANTKRFWGGYYYYVPVEFKPEFSKLSLALVGRSPAGTASSTGKKASPAQGTLQNLNNSIMQQNSLF